jgi:hypothetical protein
MFAVTAGPVSDLRGCHVDRDFFSIALVSGQTLTVTATQTTDIRTTRCMIIYNPEGVAVAETTFTAQGVPTTRTWTAAEDGIHYFKIRWWSNGIGYELDIDVSG